MEGESISGLFIFGLWRSSILDVSQFIRDGGRESGLYMLLMLKVSSDRYLTPGVVFLFAALKSYLYCWRYDRDFILALAGTVATTMTYPFDLLRTRFAVQGSENRIYLSLSHAIKDIAQKEGLVGFYKGLLPSILSIIPQMGMVFEAHRFFLAHYSLIERNNVPILSTVLSSGKELICGGSAVSVTYRNGWDRSENLIYASRCH